MRRECKSTNDQECQGEKRMDELKTNKKLLCIEENHGIEFLFVEDGKTYLVYEDENGEFILDCYSDEHYLNDFDWEKAFTELD